MMQNVATPKDNPNDLIKGFLRFAQYSVYALLVGFIVFTYINSSTAIAQPRSFAEGCEVIDGNGLTYTVVTCVKNTVRAALENMMPFYTEYAKGILGAVLTIAVMIFGIRLALGGVQRPSAESFVLLFKVALISLFISDFGGFYDDIFEAIEQMMYLMTTPLIDSSMAASCPMPQTEDVSILLWARVDCLLGALIGFGTVSGGLFSGVGIIIQGALGSSFDNALFGSIGPMLIVIGLTMFTGIIFAFFRSVYMVLNAYVALAFMLMISPLIMLSILFRKTMRFFQAWMMLTISLVLQPVLVFAFLTFYILTLDKAIYEKPYSLIASISGGCTACNYTPTGCNPDVTSDSGDCRYDNWPKIIETMKANGVIEGSCNVNFASANEDYQRMFTCIERREQGNLGNNRSDSNYIFNTQKQNEGVSCQGQLPPVVTSFASSILGFVTFSAEMTCLHSEPTEVMVAFFMVALLSYVMFVTLMYIPDFATALANPFGEGRSDAGNLSNVSAMPFEEPLQSGAAQVGKGIMEKQQGDMIFQRGVEGVLGHFNIRR